MYVSMVLNLDKEVFISNHTKISYETITIKYKITNLTQSLSQVEEKRRFWLAVFFGFFKLLESGKRQLMDFFLHSIGDKKEGSPLPRGCI